MAPVHVRVFLAFGAWLLGVGAATGGSLVAVSLIGPSIDAAPTQQLTVSAVNRALASAGRDPDATPSDSPSATARHRTAPVAAPSPQDSASAPSSSPGTLLSSTGGSVVAVCGTAGAYLISWSPQQGYAAENVARGPAPAARVLFLAGQQGVSMTVSCAGSVPSASVHPVGDDGDGATGDD